MSPNNTGGGVRSIKLARVIFLSIVKLNFTKNVLKTMFPGGEGVQASITK